MATRPDCPIGTTRDRTTRRAPGCGSSRTTGFCSSGNQSPSRSPPPLEAAQHAARLVDVTYDAQPPSTDLTTAPADPPTTYARGDADTAVAAAPGRLDLTYRLARNHHIPMEPHATIARWEGDQLMVWDKIQWVLSTQAELAAVFGIPQQSVRVISPFVGGGFGSGLRTWPHATIAALAAREVGRPVKLVLNRRQQYFGTGFRPAYDYRIRVGSDRRGRLIATVQDIRAETSSYETFTEAVLGPGHMLYSTPNVRQAYSTVPLDVNTPIWMRGPGYSTGAHIVECAMDELGIERDVHHLPGNSQELLINRTKRRMRTYLCVQRGREMPPPQIQRGHEPIQSIGEITTTPRVPCGRRQSA